MPVRGRPDREEVAGERGSVANMEVWRGGEASGRRGSAATEEPGAAGSCGSMHRSHGDGGIGESRSQRRKAREREPVAAERPDPEEDDR